MKKGQTEVFAGVALVFALSMGAAWLWHNRGNFVPGRGPASYGGPDVGMEIDPADQRRQKIRLVQAFRIAAADGTVALSPGAFRTPDGRNICELYPKIEIRLRAEGVSVSGEAPLLTLTYTCGYEIGDASVEPARIPVERLMARSPEIDSFSDEGIDYVISVPTDFWPEEWHVAGLRLLDSGGQAALAMTGYEVNFVNGGPLTVLFK
jgi:hypothetical protein